MSPQEIIRRCDDLETALREYQRVVEGLISPGMSSKREGGIAEHLSEAFQRVRQSYIPLEPFLGGRKRRIRRDGREFWEPWSDVPTFRGVRTMADFQATFSLLDWLRLDEPFSGKNLIVHQELQGYFECLDAVRREAERQIQHASDTPSNFHSPNTIEDCVEVVEDSHKTSKEETTIQANIQPTKRRKGLDKHPSKYEIEIYRISLTGKTQYEIAATMEAERGIPCNQSKVSRSINKVKRFLERGNVLPDLSPKPARKITVDPSKLEKGPRLDGRKPQR